MDAYEQIARALPAATSVACPSHGDGRVHVVYTGDPDSRIGYAIAWCDACHEGVSLDRLHVPAGVEMLPFGASGEERAKVVPPDVRLLPPDPYLDGVEEADF